MSSGQQVLKATFWYTFSNFLLKGLAFITTPIFARILTKEEFGSFANYSTWYGMISIVATLSLTASFSRGRFDFKEDLKSFIASNLVLGSLVTTAVFLIIFLKFDIFSSFLVIEYKYIFIMFFTMICAPAYEFFLSVQRCEYKYKTVAMLSILTSVISVVISLMLIFSMKDHLLARILGNAIPTSIISFILYFYFVYNCKTISKEHWRYSLLISVPYIFHLLSGSVLSQSDRAMITAICGLGDTALYSMAYNIALIVNMLWMSMNNAFGPWLGEKLIASQHSSIRKYTRPYLTIFTTLIVGLILIAPEALIFLGGQRYLEAKYVIPPVMVGCYFIFVYSMYVNVEQFEKRTTPMAIATFIAALINILTNWLFIPIFGYIAAAYTTLFCYFLLWLFHYFLVRRMGLHIIYDTKFIVLVSIAVCLVMLLSLFLYDAPIFIRYGILLIYAGGLTWIGVKNKEKIMVYFKKR